MAGRRSASHHEAMGAALVPTARHVLGRIALPIDSFAVPPGADVDAALRDAAARVRALDRGEGVLVLTDLYGATPCNIGRQAGRARRRSALRVRPEPADAAARAELSGAEPGRTGADRRERRTHGNPHRRCLNAKSRSATASACTRAPRPSSCSAAGFQSRNVWLIHRGQEVNAKSIMGVMMLAAGVGSIDHAARRRRRRSRRAGGDGRPVRAQVRRGRVSMRFVIDGIAAARGMTLGTRAPGRSPDRSTSTSVRLSEREIEPEVAKSARRARDTRATELQRAARKAARRARARSRRIHRRAQPDPRRSGTHLRPGRPDPPRPLPRQRRAEDAARPPRRGVRGDGRSVPAQPARRHRPRHRPRAGRARARHDAGRTADRLARRRDPGQRHRRAGRAGAPRRTRRARRGRPPAAARCRTARSSRAACACR